MEGYQSARWVLIDLADVVIHVFHKDERNYYTTYHKVGLVLVDHILDSFQHIGSFSKQPDHMILLL
jgi:hypothetical protein